MNELDIAALALLAAFGYGGYRRGLLVFVLHLLGGLLAFALAAVLAPVLAPSLAVWTGMPPLIAQPIAVVALTAVLRVLFGFALRELTAALRAILQAAPPLALLDRVLGIVPGVLLGAGFVLAVTLAALRLPLGAGVRATAEASWMARAVIAQPEQVLVVVRDLWQDLVLTPPRLNARSLTAATAALWAGAWLARLALPDGGRWPRAERRACPAAPVPALDDAPAVPAATRTLAGLVLALAVMAMLFGYVRAWTP